MWESSCPRTYLIPILWSHSISDLPLTLTKSQPLPGLDHNLDWITATEFITILRWSTALDSTTDAYLESTLDFDFVTDKESNITSFVKEATEAMASVTGDYPEEPMTRVPGEFSTTMESNMFISALAQKEANVPLAVSTTMLPTAFQGNS